MNSRLFGASEGMRLLMLSFALVIGLLIISPTQTPAQLIVKPGLYNSTADNSALLREGVSSQVIAVNGDMIQLVGGFSADLSVAEFQGRLGEPSTRPAIRVGDIAKVFGTVVSAPGQPVVIKAATAQFDTGKEFFYMGIVQDSNTEKNSITVLNREIQLAAVAELFNKKGKVIKLKAFKPNAYIDLDGIGLDTGIIVNRLIKLKFDDGPSAQIIGFVKSVSGTVVELEGGFKFDLKSLFDSSSDPIFDVFKDTNNFGPGTEVLLGLLAGTAMNPPSGNLPVDGAFGFTRGPVNINANLQAVDPVAGTITVLNRTFAIPENAYVMGSRGKTTLNNLLIGDSLLIMANRNGTDLTITVINQPTAR